MQKKQNGKTQNSSLTFRKSLLRGTGKIWYNMIVLKCSVEQNKERKKKMANKKTAENLLIVNFKVESKTYQAFSELKDAVADDNYFVQQAAIVKKENGEIVVKDEFDTGIKAVDDTLKGGLIGGLVGLLGGPLGVLLGGSVGALIGDAKDTDDAIKDLTLLDRACQLLMEGETALVILADEKGDAALTAKMGALEGNITRMNANEMAKEIERAEKAEEKRDEKALKEYCDKEVSENLLIVDYKNESDVYQVFSSLKELNDYFFISQAMIVKKENGKYIVKDEFDDHVGAVDDTLKGGLIGSLIGILGGPVGILLGGSVGTTVGTVKDTGDVLDGLDLIDFAYDHIAEGETVLILLADEKGDEALTEKLNAYECSITRLAAPEVMKEIDRVAALEAKRDEIDEERAELDAKRAELDAARKELNAKSRALNAQSKKLDAAREEIDANL